VRIKGIGLHSGDLCTVELSPRDKPGIAFKTKMGILETDYRSVQASGLLCTQLNNVRTVEHLMAALWAMGVTNAVISVDGDEIPIMDGSSLDFMQALEPMITEEPITTLRVLRHVQVEDKKSKVSLSPQNRTNETTLSINVNLDTFNGRLPQCDTFQYDHRFCGSNNFLESLGDSRTFGFEADVFALRKMGLAKGGSLDNCIVFSGDGTSRTLNEEGLRSENEWVRHKALDVFGDLSLCGFGAMHAIFQGTCPGHFTTNLLVRKLFADPSNYDLVLNTK